MNEIGGACLEDEVQDGVESKGAKAEVVLHQQREFGASGHGRVQKQCGQVAGLPPNLFSAHGQSEKFMALANC
jgi:hypothetical protein